MWLGALFHVSDAFLGACNACREPSYSPSWACVVVGACTETGWLLEEFRFRSITQTAHATATPSRSSKKDKYLACPPTATARIQLALSAA